MESLIPKQNNLVIAIYWNWTSSSPLLTLERSAGDWRHMSNTNQRAESFSLPPHSLTVVELADTLFDCNNSHLREEPMTPVWVERGESVSMNPFCCVSASMKTWLYVGNLLLCQYNMVEDILRSLIKIPMAQNRNNPVFRRLLILNNNMKTQENNFILDFPQWNDQS